MGSTVKLISETHSYIRGDEAYIYNPNYPIITLSLLPVIYWSILLLSKK